MESWIVSYEMLQFHGLKMVYDQGKCQMCNHANLELSEGTSLYSMSSMSLKVILMEALIVECQLCRSSSVDHHQSFLIAINHFNQNHPQFYTSTIMNHQNEAWPHTPSSQRPQTLQDPACQRPLRTVAARGSSALQLTLQIRVL